MTHLLITQKNTLTRQGGNHTVEQIITIIIALALIAAIVWWFFAPRRSTNVTAKRSNDHQQASVTVSGGYSPEVIVFEQGTPATLLFHRENPSGCFDEVVFPDFGISEKLPVGEDFAINISTDTPGEFQYSCGMRMFFGKVIIK